MVIFQVAVVQKLPGIRDSNCHQSPRYICIHRVLHMALVVKCLLGEIQNTSGQKMYTVQCKGSVGILTLGPSFMPNLMLSCVK